MIIIPIVCIIWDYCTGWHEWSLDFVMPIVFLVVQISMFIITKVQKLPVAEYMIYYIMACLLGLLPAISLSLRTSGFVIFDVLCGGFSFLWLIGLLIFKGKDMFVELYKKLHF